MTVSIDRISDENRALNQNVMGRTGGLHRPTRRARNGAPTPPAPAPAKPNPWHVNVHPAERVASCVLGGALLGLGVSAPSPLKIVGAVGGAMLLSRGLSGHCGGYALMNRSTASRSPAPAEAYQRHAIHQESSVTIARPAHELYAYWRQFDHLPVFMAGLESVTILDNTRSHWVARAPAGTVVQWEAEIINDQPDRLIAWRSLGNADVDNAGSVRFVDAPGNRGTEVRVVIDYIPPGGVIGKAVARLFGTDPRFQVEEDLRRFKQLMEAGELPTTSGQPMGGRC